MQHKTAQQAAHLQQRRHCGQPLPILQHTRHDVCRQLLQQASGGQRLQQHQVPGALVRQLVRQGHASGAAGGASACPVLGHLQGSRQWA